MCTLVQSAILDPVPTQIVSRSQSLGLHAQSDSGPELHFPLLAHPVAWRTFYHHITDSLSSNTACRSSFIETDWIAMSMHAKHVEALGLLNSLLLRGPAHLIKSACLHNVYQEKYTLIQLGAS